MAPYTSFLSAFALIHRSFSTPLVNFTAAIQPQVNGRNSSSRVPVRFELLHDTQPPPYGSSTVGRYYATVKLGNQNVDLLIDTASDVLWAFSPASSAHGNRSRYYDPSESTTSQKAINSTFSIAYEAGFATGDIYNDQVCIGSLCLSSVPLGSVKKLSSPLPFEAKPSDDLHGGILPLLKRVKNAVLDTGSSFLDVLVQALPGPFVFLNLGAGYLEFGMPNCDGKRNQDDPLLDQIFNNTIVVTQDDSLGLVIAEHAHIEVNGSTSQNFSLLFDSGTPGILLPEDVVTMYYEQINGSTIQEDGQWTLPCAKESAMEGLGFDLVIRGHVGQGRFSFPSRQMVAFAGQSSQNGSDSAVCVGMLQSIGSNASMGIAGAPLYANYPVLVEYHANTLTIGANTAQFAKLCP